MTDGHRPAFYAVIGESSVRLRTLIDHVYYRYNSQGLSMDAGGGTGTLVLPPSTGTVLMYVRYLAMELDDFARLYMRNRDRIASSLGDRELCALHSLLRGQKGTAGLIRELRGDIGDGSGLLLKEIASRVGSEQLEKILLYAMLVVEFQGRLTDSGVERGGFTAPEWRSILASPRPRSFGQAYDLRDEYGQRHRHSGVIQHLRAYSLMYERWEGMQMVREMLDDCIGKFEKEPGFKTEKLTWTSYMIKYMVVDLANFTVQYETLGEEEPAGFAKHGGTYASICNKYLAGGGGHGEDGVARMIRDTPGLLAMAIDDVEEAGFFLDRVRGEFARAYSMPSSPLYSPDLGGVSREFGRIRDEAGAAGAGRGTEPEGGIAGVFGQPA